MVAKGQFLERPTLIQVGAQALEGVSHRGTKLPLLLVLPPTPAEGGGMDTVVGAELAFAAASAGYPCLRFNFRGVGASQGPRSQGKALLEDALAAVQAGADNVEGGPVLLASINGADALALEVYRQARAQLAGVCLVSPLNTGPADWPDEVWVIVGEHDKALSSSTLGARGHRALRIPGADRTFQCGLPLVGKAVVDCLAEASRARKD